MNHAMNHSTTHFALSCVSCSLAAYMTGDARPDNMGAVINLQPSTFFCSEIGPPVWFERLMDIICQSVIA